MLTSGYQNPEQTKDIQQSQQQAKEIAQFSESSFQKLDEAILTDYEKKFMKYLVDMHNSLRKDKISLSEIQSIHEAIETIQKAEQDDYICTLIWPEKNKGAKIPATVPLPSASFQLHSSRIVETNSSGHAALMFNPYFLGADGSNQSTLWLNNDDTLTGVSSNDNFNAINIQQLIPQVYNKYRLVSASIVVKYVGRLDIVQGVIGGAIVFDQNTNSATISNVNNNLAQYGDFNLAMDSYFFQENMTLNGVREIYFPLDPTYEEYLDIGQSRSGYNMFCYIYSGVPNAKAYKVDIYCNFECLPDATFRNYIPTSAPSEPVENKHIAVDQVKKAPITQSEEANKGKTPKQNKKTFWENLKNKVGEYLPSILRWGGRVLPIPYAGTVGKYAGDLVDTVMKDASK
jgi:hypothetical protein